MNMSMCEVPVHPVEFLTEADIAALPELPMTLDEDGTYYCDGESTQVTTTGAQLFDFDNAIQKVIGNWVKNNILSIADTNDISVSWKKISGTATSYIALVAHFTFETGRTIYITKGNAQHFLVYDSDGNNLENGVSNMYTPNEDFSGYIGIGIDKGGTIDSELIFSYDSTFQNAEPYTGGIPSPNPDYPQPIINTYKAGTYRAVCGDKVYKVVLDDDLRSVPGVADRVRIDARRGCMWVERKVDKFLITSVTDISKYAGIKETVTNFRSKAIGAKQYGKAVCNRLKYEYRVWNDDITGIRPIENNYIDFTLPYSVLGIMADATYTERTNTCNAWLKNNEFICVCELEIPTTNQSVPTLLTTIEPAKSLTIENTVNAPAEVRVRGDSWQRSTTGAQLFPFSGTVDNVNFTATIEKNEITITSKVSSSGIMLITLPIDVKAGETYIFMAEYEKGLANIDVLKSDGTRETVLNRNKPFTAKEGYIYKAKIYLNPSGGTIDIGDTRTYRNVMLNAGSTALPWEPYTGNAPSPSPEYPQDIISTSGILKSTNNSLGGRDKLRESQIAIPELRAIPGTDVRDELVVYPDGTGKIVRRVKRRILKNTDNWVHQGENTTLMFTTLIGGANIDNAVICNFGLHDNKRWQTEQFAYIGKHKRLLIKLGYVGVETIGEWKEKLKTAYESGIPFYVDYALETPTEELLTADQVQGILRIHQYHTEIGWEGLDEHLEPEVEVKCKVLGR